MLASPAASPGSAQDVTFTATTGAGMMYGVARELVYSVYKSESGLLSELDWDLRPLAYAKAALTVNAGRGFVASVDVRLGIPAKTGLMTDSDWKNYPYNGSTAKTHYSQNDCFSERAILLDSQIGWQFPLAGWITLRPFVGFDFMEFKWSARDGYYEYPPEGKPPYTPWYSGENHLPMSGVSIVYQQTWFIPAAGVEAKLRFGNDLSASVAFAFSPVLFCNDLDDHIFARYAFYDYSWGGFMLEPKVSLDWEVTPRTRLSLAVSFRHIEGLVGTTYVVETGAPATPDLVADKRKNGAGASFDALDASLSFTLTL
jgi:outer membrane protease